MENMVLASPILSDAATLTSSSSPSGLSVENLKVQTLGKVLRCLDPSAAYVVADLGSAHYINLVALLGHTGSSRSYARVRASNSMANLTSSPSYDSGNVPFRSHQSGYDSIWAAGVQSEEYGALDTNHFIHWIGSTPQNFRYWRVDFVDPNSSYIDVGRLYISNAWQPTTNMDYGLAQGIVDPSRSTRTVGSRLSAKRRKKYRFSEFKLSFSSENEMYDDVFELEWNRGTTDDVLFIQDPSARVNIQRRTIYGVLQALQPIINSNFSIFEKNFRIEEII